MYERSSCMGMTTHHLTVRVGKHIDNCHVCKEKPVSVNDFKIMKPCSSEYNTKIHEALLIKKVQPKTELTIVCKWLVTFVKCILTCFYSFLFSIICVTLLISFQCYVMVLLHAA